jgi:hypothetical protein
VKPVQWIAICAVFLPGFAVAQTDADRAFAQCGTISDANARLACYDDARNQSKSAHWPEFGASPGHASPAQPPMQQAARPLPSPAPDHGKLTAAISHFSLAPNGRFIVVLDNGQIWRQLDSDDGAAQFKQHGGNVAQISKGFWGSYDLKLNNSNIVYKVTRTK